MKKITIAIIAVIVLALGAIFVVAQKSDGKGGRGFGKRGGHGRGGMMMRGLDLTEEQKGQFKSIREASRSKVQPIREALKANRQKLHEMTKSGTFDEATVTALANEQAGLSAQLMVERARVQSQTFALLTDEQKAKAAEAREKMKERFNNRGERRRGGEKAPAEASE